jgi:hypothetical protein
VAIHKRGEYRPRGILPMSLNVALDTSIIEGETFSFRESSSLQALLRAVRAGHVHVILTDITTREIERRIRERVSEDIAKISKAHVVAVTTLIDFKAVVDKLATGAADDIVSQWHDFTNALGAEVLSTADMKAGPVLEAFFQRQPPFSIKKPSEFRDAFAIGRLREWAQAKGEPVHVVSKDGDFKAACDGKILVHQEAIGDVLSMLFGGTALARSTVGFISRSRDQIEEAVGQYLDSRFFQISEDWNAEIEDYRVASFELQDSEVIDILDDTVVVQADATVELEVDAIVHDYEHSPRDEGEYVFLLKEHVRFTASFDTRLDIAVKLEGDPKIPIAVDDVSIVEPKTFVLDEDAQRDTLSSWADDDSD